MAKILLATGVPELDEAIKKYEGDSVLGNVESTDELSEAIKFFHPEILILTSAISGTSTSYQSVLNLSRKYPEIRIIYFLPRINLKDKKTTDQLGHLVLAGVFDIIEAPRLSRTIIQNAIENPKTEDEVSHLTKNILKEQPTYSEFELDIEDDSEDEDDDNNIFVFSSIKPGTGKSMLSVNTAMGLAYYGRKEGRNKQVKVGIIEADLQNLSIGTLLSIEDDKRNLKTAFDLIASMFNRDGDLIVSEKEMLANNEEIMKCFLPHPKVSNLKALTGSQLSFETVSEIKDYHFAYLLDMAKDYFDVVIVDSNSSLNHTSTLPVFQMAKRIYYVINLDFNNIRNNIRYRESLKSLGIYDKVKYILNEDVPAGKAVASTGQNLEELQFRADHLSDGDFNLVARVPVIPKTVFLNRIYEGMPIIVYEKDYVKSARIELVKICEDIWSDVDKI